MQRLKLILFLFFVLFGSSTWAAGKRYALVIGNSHYDALQALDNPSNDAIAVANKLKALGFELIGVDGKTSNQPILDIKEDHFVSVIKRFSQRAEGAEMAMIYYAGHGMQFGTKPYLLPTDIPMGDIDLMQRHAISLDDVLNQLDGQAHLTIAVFDACREIPEVESLVANITRSTGISINHYRGLARVQSKGRSRVVAFSGAAGQLVEDGQGQHSPYTEQLLNQLDQPQQEVGNMFRQVAYRFGQRHDGQHPEVLIQGVQPQYYYFSQSTHVEKPQTSNQYPFYIKTTPADAQVRILNIGPAYQTGMKLKQGQYKIEVTKAGYARHVSQFELTASNQVYHVELESGQANALPAQQTKPTSSYPQKIEVVDGRYTDNGDGTVTDSTTGLQWMRCSLGKTWQNNDCIGDGAGYTWQEAQDKAKTMAYARHFDWRVPTIGELKSLIYCSSGKPKVWNDTGSYCEEDYQKPAIVSQVFPKTETSPFWSASPHAAFSDTAWSVGFYNGYSYYNGKTYSRYVRLVRKGQ